MAWLAGGCVRDLLLKRTPKDWDIVTNAPFATLKTLFPQGLEVGAQFGIWKMPPQGDIHMDVAIFRKEADYEDHRHPSKIEAGTPEEDANRRDFSINALFYDPFEGRIIDFVGGQKDMQAKVIRAVGNPMERFKEDGLRLLRAIRFVCQLGFKLDRPTSQALKINSIYLKPISRERIREELYRILHSPRPIAGLELLAQNSMWETVFGIKKVSIPADLRHLRLPTQLPAIHWICALSVIGLLGNPCEEARAIEKRLREHLRLTNEELRLLHHILTIYDENPSTLGRSSPEDWVNLARANKGLIEILKSFTRRARGPNETIKEKALHLLDQSLRWASKPNSEKEWPKPQELMAAGLQGEALGRSLREKHWDLFLKQRPN